MPIQPKNALESKNEQKEYHKKIEEITFYQTKLNSLKKYLQGYNLSKYLGINYLGGIK